MAPPIFYVKNGEVNVAYQVVGEGPHDLLMIPGWISHLAMEWEEPTWVRFIERLTPFAGATTAAWASVRECTLTGYRPRAMAAASEIRPFHVSDVDAIVAFSLRAWEPVFNSLRQVLGDAIFDRLHKPDWQTAQADAVRSSCTSEERDVLVAVVDHRPVGFAAVALNAFHEGMGVVDIIAVDPAYQRRGIATQLMDASIAHMRDAGMDIAAVGTGGDPGHAPARAMYEASGFTALPGVRYLKLF